jgi:hypothetical protein
MNIHDRTQPSGRARPLRLRTARGGKQAEKNHSKNPHHIHASLIYAS